MAKAAPKAKAQAKKVAVKAPRKVKNPQEKFAFITQALNNKEDYFRLSFGTELLAELLNVLVVEAKVPRAEVERLVQGTHAKKSLKELMEQLRVKQE